METFDWSKIENSSDGIFTERVGSPNLVITFGGIVQGLGIPVFEFFNVLKSQSCDKIFLRDFNQAWYQKGIDLQLNDIVSIQNYLLNFIEKGKYNKLVFLGNSMGGYAAILFGTMLNANNIICFSPQTFIDRRNRLLFWDRRWRKELRSVYKDQNKNSLFFDLKVFLQKNRHYTSKIDIYFSSKHRLDRIHAEHLKSQEAVELHPYPNQSHNIVKLLRDTGELKNIITRLF